jgi:hypothetical protein
MKEEPDQDLKFLELTCKFGIGLDIWKEILIGSDYGHVKKYVVRP